MTELARLPEPIVSAYTRANVELPQMLLAQIVRVGESSTAGIVNGDMPWQALTYPLADDQIADSIAPPIERAHAAYGIECRLDPDPDASYGYNVGTRQFSMHHVRGQVSVATSNVLDINDGFASYTGISGVDSAGSKLAVALPDRYSGVSAIRAERLDQLFTSDDLHAHRLALLSLWRCAGTALTAHTASAKQWREELRDYDSSQDQAKIRTLSYQHYLGLLGAVQHDIQESLPAISSETGVDLRGLTFMR